jgi:hypothetical protein
MESQRNTFAVEYLVTRTGRPGDAKIFASGEEVAEIQKGEGQTCVMKTKDGETLILSRTVNGEVRPFSLEMTALKSGGAHAGEGGISAFTIRDHLFEHHGKIYMLTNSPEGRPLREFLLGKRYICRLDNFPFSRLAEMDHETRSRLRRFRGVPVGEMDGIGTEGHHVRLSEELEDIGMPLAAACYLLYSTA